MIYYLKKFHLFLKTHYSSPLFKPLRRKILSDFFLTIFSGILAGISALLFGGIAVLKRKSIQEDFYQNLHHIADNALFDDFTGPLIPLYKKKRLLEVATFIRLTYAENIKTIEDAQGYVGYKLDDGKYQKDNFTSEDIYYLIQIVYHSSFDDIRKQLKNMSFINYQLLLYLSVDNIADPYPQEFMYYKYNKNGGLATFIDHVFRNPGHFGFQISEKFTTSDLSNTPILGYKNTYAKVFIEGIGEQELGEQFYYTPDLKYYHYQHSHPNEKSGFQFGFGFLKPPPMHRSRPYLDISKRTIKETILKIK